MSLSAAQKKSFRSIGHQLSPIVQISGNGASSGVIGELNRALTDHELVKVSLAIGDREARHTLIDRLAREAGAEIVQTIGKMALLYRHNPEASSRLSNVARHSV